MCYLNLTNELKTVDDFIELFSKLDTIDQGKVLGTINTLLDADKYSTKQKIVDRTDNIITVNFN